MARRSAERPVSENDTEKRSRGFEFRQLEPDDAARSRIASALRNHFGTRLVSALLFGSRASGTARPQSDYDVAVFLAGYTADLDGPRLSSLAFELSEPGQPRVHVLGFPRNGLAERTTLMFNIRNTAVPLPGMDRPEVGLPLGVAEESGPLKPETAQLMMIAETKLDDARRIRAAGVLGSAARSAHRGEAG